MLRDGIVRNILTIYCVDGNKDVHIRTDSISLEVLRHYLTMR